MGIGEGKGEKRNEIAVRQAIASPLLETSINGAKAVIINVKGGFDLTLEEVNDAVNMVKEVVSPDANTIFGATIDENYNDRMIVTIVATGFEGSRFENATAINNQSQRLSLMGQDRPQIARPQDTGNFDRTRFNDFVTGKPTISLFEKSAEYQNMKNLNQSLRDPSRDVQREEPVQSQKPYTNMDLWNKLNGNNSPRQEISNEELDKKYGLTNNYNPNIQNNNMQREYVSPMQGLQNQSVPKQEERQNSNLQSNIKIENADIPPFLRRKFNK